MTPVVVRQPRTRIRHATLTYQDERNAALTVRGIGYEAECECGAQFRVRASWRMARADLANHPCTMRPPKEG